MKWGIIATWRMALEGVSQAAKELEQGVNAGDALEHAIRVVEDNPRYRSVGYGGLPNEHGIVELDAAFMDGDHFDIGAVAAIQDVKNPISAARKLSSNQFNRFLVGQGATAFAQKAGLERINMLTDEARTIWQKRLEEMKNSDLSPYDGHDTVGVVCLDLMESMTAGTSSSGLFMKKSGRVGDSPLSGSGFYVDSEIGGATATGLGEDLLKGCLCYEIVRLMGEGMTPQEAADRAVYRFHDKLVRKKGKAGAMSLICMNKHGEWGVATNVEFPFVVATEEEGPTVYIANKGAGHSTMIERATREQIEKCE
ncbi:isoaspartyl peptidase/L-asparaginase-like protein (Ntn-hydrolase superfamily) [Bacillus niacini]|uniref:Isoaspartyl peptidase/L-asparaginase-like protein (Ntn-hydrolase superfamily) n=1 Tax=Neobacillus niacini TaxID=86668 RepID=A0A852T6M3_9BACI|nr:N(4)-(beta-N-acetylglucosaminyl)-L-asparaginase [Neobacillus niacini]NYE03467.1 isoaspartyl peptidase/L-asparaginase-like protein (Ntn-hydrolase superfamily) [Neobacillus niacini]